MIRALFFVLLALCVSVARAACPPVPAQPTAEQSATWAAQARDRGPLWRITRGGHSSYLFGSLHLGKPDWAYPGPTLRRAWEATEVLAVELDPADVGPALSALPAAEPLSPALARGIEAQARAACLPPGALATLPAMLQLTTLTLLEARRDGFDAAFGQDLMLVARAKAEGRPVQSLESVEQQLDALEPTAAELPEVVGGALRQLQRGELRAPLRKLADAWARADLKTLADYPRWCRCADTPAERDWMRRVNDDRNIGLSERIDALHGAGQRLLVAVGALHMTGPQALPRLLAQRGFTVERMPPAE
ncbi:TraB/GumN family protein [Roseateles cellulosilyticus]|uniref:TraB/GumN family protein n=1 Tax=Pelomonas cellulosilytica TaxID=2906762 RepID=A0ABS8XTJ3_9BURK|nr:TraB/GumN family protein [Pelomonas sp. P8]MCE4554217.1 TraB/GumN family protein [Pelomonas sp. P8]